MKKGLPLDMMPHSLFVQFWPPACTDCKFGHHNAPPAAVANLATTCIGSKVGHITAFSDFQNVFQSDLSFISMYIVQKTTGSV